MTVSAVHSPPITVLALLLLLPFCTALPSSRLFASQPCRYGCRFTFCSGSTRLLFGAPNRGIVPRICKPGRYIGRVLSTGEAKVSRSGMGHPVRISQWRPTGLSHAFLPHAIRCAGIPGVDASGVVKTPAVGNQHMYLDGVCVVLAITEYEAMDEGGRVVKVKATKGEVDCVSFRAVAARVVVELRWLSGDDLDLTVVEPDGDRVDFRKTSSESGALWSDSGVDSCGVYPVRIERTVYRVAEMIQSGKYEVKGIHTMNCGFGATRWRLTVTVDGRVVKRATGLSDEKKAGSVIKKSVFTFRI